MLKKTITYTDFNGNERTEDFYFNLTERELTKLELTTPGGFEGMVKRIVNAKSQIQLIELFEQLIKMSYGVKDADGIHFVKNEKVLEEFMSTQAYSDLYMELVTDADKAAAFFNGIVPAKKAATNNAIEMN